jgi:hypothetical protein
VGSLSSFKRDIKMHMNFCEAVHWRGGGHLFERSWGCPVIVTCCQCVFFPSGPGKFTVLCPLEREGVTDDAFCS